jgi:biopolymer transport protein ExbD/biopolymer transport protein TolR
MTNAEKEDAIVVAITRDGKTYLGTTLMKAEDMAPKVKDLLTNRLDKTTYVKADQRARYQKVVEVVDNLRAAGVDQLGLLTDAKDEKHAPAPNSPAK